MNRSSLNNNRSIATKITANKMKSSKKIAPISIGEGDHQCLKRSSREESRFTKTRQRLVNKIELKPHVAHRFTMRAAAMRGNMTVYSVQDHVMAKTASCPAHLYIDRDRTVPKMRKLLTYLIMERLPRAGDVE